jgi:hypothetical protein
LWRDSDPGLRAMVAAAERRLDELRRTRRSPEGRS